MYKKRRNLKSNITGKRLLFICTIMCVVAFAFSFMINNSNNKLVTYSNVLFAPMKKGVSLISNSIISLSDIFTSKTNLIDENNKLKKQIEDLVIENNKLKSEHDELVSLRNQLSMLPTAADEYIGARVIGKNNDNWFNIITIDKGSQDGIEIDMNVISNGALVGIVTSVNYHSALVRTIVDDLSATSATIQEKDALFVIEGNLNNIRNGYLSANNLNINTDIKIGDRVITSNVSKKYLPDQFIGYVSDVIKNEKNIITHLKVTPSANFSYLKNVMVIKNKKGN